MYDWGGGWLIVFGRIGVVRCVVLGIVVLISDYCYVDDDDEWK